MNKKMGVAALLLVILPLLAAMLGVGLDAAIPGCTVDEGAGGHGCIVLGTDFSGLVAFLELGGFIATLLSVPLAIVVLILSVIVGLFQRRQPFRHADR